MVFPVETEDRTMRNLLMLCQDHARLIVECFRKILSITDALVKNSGTSAGQMDNITSIISETKEIKNTLIKELHEIGGVMVNREEFFRLIITFGDIMDHINAIGIRYLEMEKRDWDIPEEISEGLTEISDIAFDTLIKLRESVMSLGFNSEKTLAFTREIEEIEKQLDIQHLEVQMTIITSGLEIYEILILKDITAQIEEMVDTVRTASDLIRIIAF
jgi:uncharacterized protein Yka (UPF0111/DUF47 family)